MSLPLIILFQYFFPLAAANPVALELVIPDCCEGTEIIPQKSYFGRQEGVGEYIWYRTKSKLDGTTLMEISNACEDVVLCSKML